MKKVQTFGKYYLQRRIAEGGMAEVFLAKQTGMDGFEKPVVIKRILPHLAQEPAFIDMFLHEAKVAARLSHPAIAQIFDFGRVDQQYYIAMEFIHGEDLRNLAKAAERAKKRPTVAMVARVMADVLGALHYAHTRAGSDGQRLGLVHRDISPQNILVTYEGGVKLVDFGIAKATESNTAAQTQAGLLKGKYAYMSPEQCNGRGIDARSDVFAVGILAWELLTWKRLFRRDTDLATLVAVGNDPIPPVSMMRSDVPRELDEIVSRALQRPLEERYQSAQAMQADLEAVIRRYSWEADSISISRYMREVFADKLRMQDEALRAAGVGSLEDFLVQADEATRMKWMEPSPVDGNTPSAGLALPLSSPALPPSSPALPLSSPALPLSSPALPLSSPALPPSSPALLPSSPPSSPSSPSSPVLEASTSPVQSAPTMALSAAAPIIGLDDDVRGPDEATRLTNPSASRSPVPSVTPSRPMRIAPTPPVTQELAATPPGWADRTPELTGSTLRHAVGERMPRDARTPRDVSVPPPRSPRQPSPWLRAGMVLGVCAVVGGGVVAAVLRPTRASIGTAATGAATNPAADPDRATVHVVLERPAVVLLDGVAQPPGTEADVIVKARTPHELRVRPLDGAARPGPALSIPPLEPGEVKTIRPRVGN